MVTIKASRRSTLTLPNLANRLIRFETIMKEPLPPIDWLVEGLIPRGERTLLYGEWGCMKSWVLLHLGLHIAAGKPWLGRFPIAQPRSVLYLDEEMPERALRRRIKQLGIGAELATGDLPFCAISHLGSRFREGYAEDLLKELRDKGFDPDVVIVETFRRVLVGNENEASDVSAFWQNVSPIQSEGKSLIVSHHMRKPSTMGHDPNRNRASGSTDIMGGADNAFSVTRKHGEDAITIECEKARTTEEPSPFVMSLHERDEDNRPVEMCYEGSSDEHEEAVKKVDRAVKLVERYITGRPEVDIATGEVVEALKGEGVKERTADRALKKASKCGRVTKVRRGVWRATEQPRAA
jgi:RecA-family ATPase